MTIINNDLTNLATISFCIILFFALDQPAGASEIDKMNALLLTGFNEASSDVEWYIQNDNVMGGRSQGGFDISSGELIFSGSTNTNGGGFSSIRTQALNLDLSGYAGIRVKVKADGRRYTWQLQTNARWRGRQINYWADFNTVADEMNVINIPFTSFFPQLRGYMLDGPELDTSQVTEFGLYIYDKKDGPFELHLMSVEAYADGKSP
jgi:NADH dehydrogenase [ubiquinone] 1 alpha subcomplex assembly factor 1